MSTQNHSGTLKEQKQTSFGHDGGSHGQHKKDYLLWGSSVSIAILYLSGVFSPETVSVYPFLKTMVHTVHHMINAIWWGLALGGLLIGLMSKIPREFIASLMGKGGSASGLMRAIGVGVCFDFLSHGSLLIMIKLYERGISAGQLIALLLASPWNSLALSLVLAGMVGSKWVALFIGLSMMIALITGWVFDRLVASGVLTANPNAVSLPRDFNFCLEAKTGMKQASFDLHFFKEAVSNGARVSKMMLRWIFLGILIASVLRATIDPCQFEQLFGPHLTGLIVTMFSVAALEVCSEGSTHVAADILTRGQTPGSSFSFLMASVALNYVKIMILKEATKSWKIALFLPLIAVPQVLFVAWLMNVYG